MESRGLKIPPKLPIGGFCAALDEAKPQTRCQRSWVHKTANVLNQLPKSLHGKAKAELHEIWMAETKVQAEKVFDTHKAVQYRSGHIPALDHFVDGNGSVWLQFSDFSIRQTVTGNSKPEGYYIPPQGRISKLNLSSVP